MKRYLLFLFLLLFLLPVHGWEKEKYYVMYKEDGPIIDGVLNLVEWETEEDVFTASITPIYFQGITRVEIDLIILRDDIALYVLVGVQNSDLRKNSTSVGIAFAKNSPVRMLDIDDQKVAFFNGNDTLKYDFYSCSSVKLVSECSEQELQPGMYDTSVEFTASYIYSSDKIYFEFKIPLQSQSEQDIAIEEGVYMSVVTNIYNNIVFEGHGSFSTDPLQLKFSRSIFSNPFIDIFIIIIIVPLFYLFVKKVVIVKKEI